MKTWIELEDSREDGTNEIGYVIRNRAYEDQVVVSHCFRRVVCSLQCGVVVCGEVAGCT